MQTKSCPSCGAEVPAVARTCKECFHDFEGPSTPPRSGSPMALLVSAVVMVAVAAGLVGYLTSQPTDTRILVDDSTRTVQWVTQYKDGTIKTDNLSFDQIQKLEYVITSSGDFEIAAVTASGERKVIQQHPDKPLQLQAEKYAELMGKPLDLVDNTFGFQK